MLAQPIKPFNSRTSRRAWEAEASGEDFGKEIFNDKSTWYVGSPGLAYSYLRGFLVARADGSHPTSLPKDSELPRYVSIFSSLERYDSEYRKTATFSKSSSRSTG
jgi:hypothetical protein